MNIMIADGSAVVRTILEQGLDSYPDVNIISFVSNGKKLIEAIDDEVPDVIVSGLDMSDPVEKNDLRLIVGEKKIPVILLADSSLSYAGPGLETIEKPKISDYTKEFFDSLVEKLRFISSSGLTQAASKKSSFKVLCIGASTGGPSAVSKILPLLGKNFSLPVLYAQHIDVGADKNMAEWFASVCHNIRVKLAENGEEALGGTVYMAPADKHLVIDYISPKGNPVLKLSDEEPERFLRPAVNKLFRSAARIYEKKCLAVLLTGMGFDGAEGCREICDRGGWTIVEDKSTCAVFGMPAAAIEAGGAQEILPRGEIAKRILELVGE